MSFFNLVFSYDENIVCKILDNEKKQLENTNKNTDKNTDNKKNNDCKNINTKPVTEIKNNNFIYPELDDLFFYA